MLQILNSIKELSTLAFEIWPVWFPEDNFSRVLQKIDCSDKCL